jgi:hypothetical protein
MAISHDEHHVPPLEVELADILHSAGLRGRQARAVAARLGWDGEGGCTLALAAKPEGYSRERVRQLEERLRENVGRSRPHAVAIEAAVRLIEDAAPLTLRQASTLLAEMGISRCPFQIEGLVSAADIADVAHSLRIRNGVVLQWGRPTLVAEADFHLRAMVDSMMRAGHSEREIIAAVEDASA